MTLTMQDFLDLLPEGVRDDREIINALDRLCLRFAQEGRDDAGKDIAELEAHLRGHGCKYATPPRTEKP